MRWQNLFGTNEHQLKTDELTKKYIYYLKNIYIYILYIPMPSAQAHYTLLVLKYKRWKGTSRKSWNFGTNRFFLIELWQVSIYNFCFASSLTRLEITLTGIYLSLFACAGIYWSTYYDRNNSVVCASVGESNDGWTSMIDITSFPITPVNCFVPEKCISIRDALNR